MSTLPRLISDIDSLSHVLNLNKDEMSKWEKKMMVTAKSLGLLAGGAKLLESALTSHLKVMDRLTKMYAEEAKVSGKFRDSVFQGAHALRMASKEFKTIGDAQESYKKQLNDMAKGSLFTKQQMADMYSSIVTEMKGIRSNESVGELAKIGKAFGELKGDADEGAKSLEKYMGLMNKFAGVRAMMTRASEGGLTRADHALATLLQAKGEMSSTQAREMYGLSSGQAQKPSGTVDIGREGVIAQRETEKHHTDALLAHNDAMSQHSLAMKARSAASIVSNITQANAGISGSMGSVGKTLGLLSDVAMIGGGLALGGSMLSGFLGGKGKGKSGGGMLNKLAGGAGGGVGGKGINVYVTNFDNVWGGGGGGVGGKGGGGKGGGLLSKGAALGRGGSIAKLLRVLGPIAAVGAAGFAGYKEFTEDENKGLTTGQKAGAAATKGTAQLVGTIGGGILGSALGPLGTMGGAALGGYLGGLLGEWSTDKVLEGDRKKANPLEEINKVIITDEYKDSKAGHEVANAMERERQQMEKLQMEFQTASLVTKTVTDSFGLLASGMTGLIGTGKELASTLESQSIAKEAEVKTYKDLEKHYKKRSSMEKKGSQEQITYLALAREQTGKMRVAEKESLELRIQSSTVAVKQEQEVALVITSEAKAQKNLNTIKRMGMGQSYEDTVKSVEALGKESVLKRKEAKNLEITARKMRAKGDEVGYQTAMKQAGEAHVEATNKEAEVYEEAKGMREGYLDSLRSELSATGGYAELFATRDSGVQNFAKSLGLGGIGVVGASGPGKYTTGGVQFNKGEQQRVADELLDTSSFVIGPNQNQAATFEKGSNMIVSTLKDILGAIEKPTSGSFSPF